MLRLLRAGGDSVPGIARSRLCRFPLQLRLAFGVLPIAREVSFNLVEGLARMLLADSQPY